MSKASENTLTKLTVNMYGNARVEKVDPEKRTGWTKLWIIRKTSIQGILQNKQMDKYLYWVFFHLRSCLVSCPALNVYGWIELVSVGLKPFPFTKDPLTHKYTNLGSMTTVTLKNTWGNLLKIWKRKYLMNFQVNFHW